MTGVIYSTVRETAIDRRDNGQKLSSGRIKNVQVKAFAKSAYVI